MTRKEVLAIKEIKNRMADVSPVPALCDKVLALHAVSFRLSKILLKQEERTHKARKQRDEARAEVERLRRQVGAANMLIRGAIKRYEFDGEPCGFSPCEWCAATECETCQRYTEENEGKVMFQLESDPPAWILERSEQDENS